MADIFKGPQFYNEADKSIFKGRERETGDLLYLVENSDFSVCYAVSGEGKSSLINAGLCPKLREHGFLPIHIKNIADAEADHFDEFIWQKVKDTIREEQKKPEYAGLAILKLVSEPGSQKLADSVWWKLRTRELRINSFEKVTPVLIFDQFEEVFSSAKDLNWTNTFFCWLEQLYQDESPINEAYNGVLQKRFKMLFSLRSEYVCELDYWAMNKHFIPSLKNNRYYLKPLTKGAAFEVAKQLDLSSSDLDALDIIQYAKSEHAGVWDNINNDLPCVSALILSLLLTALSERNEEIESKIKEINKSDSEDKGKELFDFLLENVYQRAITKCNDTDDVEVNKFIEVLEDTLIDVNGKRRHVPERELPAIDNEKIKDAIDVLESERIINVIDRHYEISHDSLCRIVLRRKEERQKIKAEREKLEAEREAELARQEAEEAIRRKNQTEDLTSSFFLLMFLMFFLWILSSFFQDKLSLLEVLDKNGNEVIEYKDEIMPVIVGITNLTIIPFIIYSVVKKFRITIWLSVYGLISNLVIMAYLLMNYGSKSLLVVLSVVAVGVPAVTLLYSFLFKLVGRTNMKEIRQLWSIPIVLFFLTIALYLFYLCVFNTKIGYPEPNNSSWAVIVIPLLAHELIRLWFELPVKRTLFLAFLCGLGLLAYNTWTDEFFLSKYVVWAFVSFIAIIVFVLYRRAGFKRRIFATVVETVTVVTTVILNFGFDVISIDYNNVSHVYNWREVQVKDDKGRLGIVYACNGDALLPCVFDSISKDWYACMTIKDHRLKKDTADIRELYRVEKGVATYKTPYIPSSQQYIYKIAHKERIDTTLTDSISVFAARTYFELRNLNIAYLQGGSMYAINAVKSLPKLLDLQLAELNATLLKLEKNKDMIDSELTKNFNRSFAKSFYLCLLTDRVIRKDSVNLFTISQDILPFYFYDSSNFESKSTYSGDIDFGYGSKTYHSETKVSELRDFDGFGRPVGTKQLDAWYNIAIQQMIVDASLNNQEHNARMQEKVKELHARMQEKSTKVFERQEKVKNQLARVKSTIKKNNLSREDVSSAVKNLVEADNEDRDVRAEIRALNTDLVGRLDEIDSKKEMDMIFEMLIENVYRTVSFIAKESDTNYKANFINICEWLYRVAFVRMYDNTDTYLQKLDLMYRNSMEPLEKFSSTQKEFERSMKEIREKAERLMRQ